MKDRIPRIIVPSAASRKADSGITFASGSIDRQSTSESLWFTVSVPRASGLRLAEVASGIYVESADHRFDGCREDAFLFLKFTSFLGPSMSDETPERLFSRNFRNRNIFFSFLLPLDIFPWLMPYRVIHRFHQNYEIMGKAIICHTEVFPDIRWDCFVQTNGNAHVSMRIHGPCILLFDEKSGATTVALELPSVDVRLLR